MGYLTADSVPGGSVCRVLIIPDDKRFIANVLGAIEALTFSQNYDKFGALTPAEMADANLPMFNALCFQTGVCRVIGEIIAYAGSTSPNTNWLVCSGSSLLRADYPDLFAVIGTTYGAADGTHFNLPDLTDRVLAGVGTNTLGTAYGEAQHTLTGGEVPSHTHSYAPAVASITSIAPGAPTPAALPGLSITGSSGGDGAHNNIPPTLAITYLIVAAG